MQQKTSRRSSGAPKSGSTKGEIRIIGGQWRGRKLTVLDQQGLRPTTDRVKETLFNWLAGDLYQSACLDCYAGSGSLGIEAVSRGAQQATLLEKSASAVNQLRMNQTMLNAQQLTIIHTESLQWLAQPAQQQFDIVFIDPPFGYNLVSATIDLLEQKGWLKSSALIYVETEASLSPLPVPLTWQLHRQKQAGQVCYRLYRRELITENN